MTSLWLLALALQAQSAAPSALPPMCETAEHRQFDFWLGRWDVYRPDTKQLVAHSLVERLYDGCALRENWMPLAGKGGGSLNSYRPERRAWVQSWTDWRNNWNSYEGRFEGDALVMTGTSLSATGAATPVRMRYQRSSGGGVMQTGYTSKDAGRSWQLSYQFLYLPAGSPPPR